MAGGGLTRSSKTSTHRGFESLRPKATLQLAQFRRMPAHASKQTKCFQSVGRDSPGTTVNHLQSICAKHKTENHGTEINNGAFSGTLVV